jgi:flagellar biosynthesis protein FliQ
MTPETVVQILRQALTMVIWISAPLLAVGLVVGIVVSLAQIVTSIQDTGFSTIPRLAAFVVSFLLALPWMLQKMTAYTVAIFGDLSRYAR